MTYGAWQPRKRLTTISPGKLDLIVVTLIEGKAAYIDPVTHYDAALVRAEVFHAQHPCQMKVLPLTGTEARNLLGVQLPDRPCPVDRAQRQEFVLMLEGIVRDSNDADARADAVELLKEMGALQ